MIKITGAELKAFLRDDWEKWGNAIYYEDAVFEINGNEIDANHVELDLETIGSDAEAKIVRGIVYNPNFVEICSLETLFKRWKKLQTHETLVIEAPKDQIEKIKKFIEQAKGKIL